MIKDTAQYVPHAGMIQITSQKFMLHIYAALLPSISHFGSLRVKSWARDWLWWPRFFVLLSPSRQIPD